MVVTGVAASADEFIAAASTDASVIDEPDIDEPDIDEPVFVSVASVADEVGPVVGVVDAAALDVVDAWVVDVGREIVVVGAGTEVAGGAGTLT